MSDFDVGVFVINLDRRPDRLERILTWLNRVELEAVRIQAIDGQNASLGILSRLRPSEIACWESHQKAYALFLESDFPYALILEDDAVINPRFKGNLPQTIDRLKELMSKEKIDVLQIGHISKYYGLVRFRTLLNFLVERALGSRPRMHTINGRKRIVWSDQFRYGGHAYMVSRTGAAYLQDVNKPVIFPADIFLALLAKAETWRKPNKFSIWVTNFSFLEQESRLRSFAAGDSDIRSTH